MLPLPSGLHSLHGGRNARSCSNACIHQEDIASARYPYSTRSLVAGLFRACLVLSLRLLHSTCIRSGMKDAQNSHSNCKSLLLRLDLPQHLSISPSRLSNVTSICLKIDEFFRNRYIFHALDKRVPIRGYRFRFLTCIAWIFVFGFFTIRFFTIAWILSQYIFTPLFAVCTYYIYVCTDHNFFI